MVTLGRQLRLSPISRTDSVADFDRVSGRRCHSELGKMSSGRTFATVIGAARETNCREKQAHKIAHLSH